MEELHHETGKALEGARDTDRGRDLDQHAFRRLYVDLQLPGFVNGRVEEREQALSRRTVSTPNANRPRSASGTAEGDMSIQPGE